MPYPAYGTPAPGVSVQHVQPGVPASISLPQAIAIAAARSPVLAIARSDYRLTQLSADLARTGYYPNISAVASTTRNYGTRAGSSGSGAGSGTFGNGTTSNGLNATLKPFIL